MIGHIALKHDREREKKRKARSAPTQPKVTWDRLRFNAAADDYRPVVFPPPGPYWCSGEGDDHSIIVAYVPHGTCNGELLRYWPEASHIERLSENVELTFTDRFPKPAWWTK